MRLLKLTSVVGAVLAVAAVSWAGPVIAPSFLGPSGALMTPNTEVNDLNTLDVGAHVMWIEPVAGDATLTVAKMNVCVLKDLEITPTYSALEWDWPGPGSDSSDDFTVSAKYQIWQEPSDKLGLAIGAIDLAGQIYPNIPYYFVVSKTCNKIIPDRPLRWNWGAAFGTSDVFFVHESCDLRSHPGRREKDDSHFFTSMEAEVADWCALIAEVAEEDFNYGARFVPVDNLRIDVGSVSLYGESQFVVGAAYHIEF